MAAQRQGAEGTLSGIRVDLRRLYEGWMGLRFPRQRAGEHSVLGKWKPESPIEKAGYYLWGALGALAIAIAYPLAVLGLATRFYTRRLDSTTTRIGVLGVVLVSVLVWGLLTILARLRFSTEGFFAVLAAGIVATVAAALAYTFVRVGGRVSTVVLAYPFGVTALFLPPVVAALYSPALASLVFPKSTSIAKWVLDNVLSVGNLNAYLRTNYDLEGVAYVGMWFGIAVPLGWLLGLVVTLADLVRPKPE